MRREADGVFPVTVLTPMVLVACDVACPKGLWSHVLPDPLQHVNLAQCYSAPVGHGVTDRLGVTVALADAHEVAVASSEEPSGWTHVQGGTKPGASTCWKPARPSELKSALASVMELVQKHLRRLFLFLVLCASRPAAHLYFISDENCGFVFTAA